MTAVGRTTSDVYVSLSQMYSDQQKQIAQNCADIDMLKGDIETAYNALDTKRVKPPSEQVLAEKSKHYFASIVAMEKQREAALALEKELSDGMNYLNRPPLNAETMETIQRSNPDLCSSVRKEYSICMENFSNIQQWWGTISNYRIRMDDRLPQLRKSYTYFDAIARNKGEPLSLIQRGWTGSWAVFSGPSAPKLTTPAQNTNPYCTAKTTPNSTGMEDPVVITLSVNAEEATGEEPEKNGQPEPLEVKENSDTLHEVDTATTIVENSTEPVVANTIAVTENVSEDGKESEKPQKKTPRFVDSSVEL